MQATLIRSARWLGMATVVASAGVVIGVTLWQVAGGPIEGRPIWPTPRLWSCFRTSLCMAGVATGTALLISVIATLATIRAPQGWRRGILIGLTTMPLVTMPSIFGYAWTLLSTSRVGWIAGGFRLIGWNTPGHEPWQAAWALATWLWPIPALAMLVSFRHAGLGAYQLASIDARPLRAFLRGAIPVMRAPLLAALAGVFVLAATDPIVPPLVGATQVWSTEMRALAEVAPASPRPAAMLFWQSWPMLVVIGGLLAASTPGLRQMARWADDPPGNDAGTVQSGRGAWWPVAALFVASLTMLPLASFVIELLGSRSTLGQTLSTAWKTLSRSGGATAITAMGAGMLATCMALGALPIRGRPTRWMLIFMCITAVLPPELIGTVLGSSYSRISDPAARWNLYDSTPWTWMMAVLCRFGFFPVVTALLLDRRVPRDLISAAEADGAAPHEIVACTRLPIIGRGIGIAAVVVACMTMSEVAVSVLVQPAKFFGGSLAVAIDGQMHYGRQNETVACAIGMMIPAFLATILLTFVQRGPTRRGQA